MAHRVLVTRRLPEAVLAPIRARGFVLDLFDSDEPMPHASLLEAATRKPSGIVCMLSDKLDKGVIDSCGEALKGVATMSVGYNHVDVQTCAAKGIRVGYTPGVLSEATADLVLALTLATCRKLQQGIDAVRNERGVKWGSWEPLGFCGKDLHGARVGIIGAGRIGTAIARRLKGFSCSITYTGPSGSKPDFDAEFGAQWQPLDDLLASSDIIVMICALTPATRGMINGAKLRLMKPDAVLINASRGECVVQDDLIAVLQERPGFSAGLDVTTPEPLPLDSELLSLPNCTILPHIGSASTACRMEMARVTVANVLAAIEGTPLPLEVPETASVGGAK